MRVNNRSHPISGGDMLKVQPKDSRGHFMLPQIPEQAAYYTYGTPPGGAGQYAHPKLLSLIFSIEHRWQGIDDRRIGVGNISLPGGVKYKGHKGHRSGLDVDLRLFRKDRQEARVTRLDEQYDREATAKLIKIIFEFNIIQVVYFNDLQIPGVRPLARHDDHFHLTITG
jgi:penicillin-insensitive murein endopeptidase